MGTALAFTGVFFVGIRLQEYGTQIDVAHFNSAKWLVIAAFCVIYGFANLLLALAWWSLLDWFGLSVSRGWAIKTYGITQLAKYTPGNIFHLAGRQAMGMAANLPGWPLAKSALWELGLIALAAGLFGFLALPGLIPVVPANWAPLVFTCAVGSVALAVWRFWGEQVVKAFGRYCGFLAVSGLLFAALIDLVNDNPDNLPLIHIAGAYVLAWLAGLITPGAPAGAGVRELALLFLLDGVVSQADLLLAVLLSRAITVTGDLGFFGLASLWKRKVSGELS